MVKNLPAMWETWVRLLGQEDPLKEGMTTHSIAWRIPWTEEPGGLQSMGSQRLGHDYATKYTHKSHTVHTCTYLFRFFLQLHLPILPFSE